MTMQNVAAAMQRVETVLQRRPRAGMHEDADAVARWTGDTHVRVRHANGTELGTDLAPELGGQGNDVTPGWLFRAGLASCATTMIAMYAAAEGIELKSLEVVARSRSAPRGLFGMRDADGDAIDAGPQDLQLHVRIAAPGIAAERLRALIERAHACSPVARIAENVIPIALHIDVSES